MNPLLTPPAERDLPRGAAARIRTRLLVETNGRAVPRVRRPLVAISAAAAVAAGVAGVGLATHHAAPSSVLALGPSELTGELHDGVERCLEWASQHPDIPVRMTETDFAVAAQHDDVEAILFYNNAGFFSCKQQNTGITAIDADRWQRRDWLPGPVDVLLTESTELRGGDVIVIGRVSARVHRLVLQWGGHTVEARIARGVFGLISASGAGVTGDVQLVSYDAAGQQIGRRLLFTATPDQPDHCYVNPAGTVVYGTRGANCLPAEPWTPQR
jgi:hypothetical protein